LLILQGNSCSIDQKSGEIWTVQTDLQQIYPKSDRLLEYLYGKKVVTLSQQTGNPANHFKDYCHLTVTANPAVFIKVSVTD
jgi:hypothetical protein